MVATHGDADHIGGLLDVLEAMPVHHAWLDSQTCLDLYQALADHHVVTATVRMGQVYAWGNAWLFVLNPSEPLYSEKNENSLVLRVSYGSVNFLLTGDAETGAEGRMLASGLPLEAVVLKVSHHGSDSASSAAFLAAVTPQDAIISVGPNSYGHPRPEVLQRLATAGATVYRTDTDGTVTVTTDGVTWVVTTQNQPTRFTVALPLVLKPSAPITQWPTPTATAIELPSPTATPTLTSSPTATAQPTTTATSVNTLTATPTPTHSATATLTPTPTATPTPSPSATPQPTATQTLTASPTHTSTPTATKTLTPTGTATRTPTYTATPVNPATATSTTNPTQTQIPTQTLVPTPTEPYGSGIFITETGTKYHRDGCRYLSQSKIEKTCSWVVANGYTPCSICKPVCP